MPDCLHDRAAADDVLKRIASAALPGQLTAVKLHLIGQRVHLPHQIPGVDESVGDDINKDPVDLMLRVKTGEVRGEGGYAVMGYGLNGDRFAGVQALQRLGLRYYGQHLLPQRLFPADPGVLLPLRTDVAVSALLVQNSHVEIFYEFRGKFILLHPAPPPVFLGIITLLLYHRGIFGASGGVSVS